MNMRLTLIAGAVVVLVIAGAFPAAARPQSKAAATRRPTAAEVAEVRKIIAEYRTAWMTQLDAESRAIARQYGAPTPEDLERMLREWEAGRGSMPNVPASVPGKPGGSVRTLPDNAPTRPASPRPALPRPAPVSPADRHPCMARNVAACMVVRQDRARHEATRMPSSADFIPARPLRSVETCGR